MSKKSSIKSLPKPVKDWLDKALLDQNFSGYQLLEEALTERGYHISKSAIHRYGKTFENRLAALKAVTEQARAVVQAAPDEDGSVNDALIRLTQERLFGILVDIEVDVKTVDITKLAKSVAELGRSSVLQKRWLVEVRAKAEAAVSAVEKITKKGGLSPDAADEIRREILGIVS